MLNIEPHEALDVLMKNEFNVKTIQDQVAIPRIKSATALLQAHADASSPSKQPFKIINLPDKGSDVLAKSKASSGPNKSFTAKYLDYHQVLDIHDELVRIFEEDNDPISPSGPRDLGLLESATHRPLISLGDVEKYTSIPSKAAALFHSLVLNHPFHNGNKRTALVSLLVFLDLNRYAMQCTDDELFDFVISMAKRLTSTGEHGNSDDEVKSAEFWLRDHIQHVDMQVNDMPINHLLEAIKAAGGRYKQSASGSWVVWGPNGDKSYSLPRASKIHGGQLRVVLKRIGLTYGQSGIYASELADGINPKQDLIRRFRNVLRQLASA